MNPILEKVTPSSNHSFSLKEDILPHIEIGWHFHPEYELTLIAESFGKRVIGDHIANFEAGDVLLIGPNLPHFMQNDAAFYEGKQDLNCRAIVAHFEEDFLGPSFFHRPELHNIWQLMQASHQGVHVYGESAARVAEQMEELLAIQGFDRLMVLLQILSFIANTHERETLASPGYTQKTHAEENSKIGKVFAYLFSHFSEDISLNEVAEWVSMTDSSLCKLMKRHTGKTFSYALNEIRIGHACRLLIEGGQNVGEISYLCGYSSPSYFNRKFKSIIGFSPLQYRSRFSVKRK
ncbi:MAG: AraC family transcriptional regulator [Bacteroidota bacterium]